MKTKVKRITLLADGTEVRYGQSYETARDEHRLYLFLPEECPDRFDTVIAVELEGEVEVQTI